MFGEWPEGTSLARKEQEEEPRDLELFPREGIVRDSSGAAAADCRESGGAVIAGRARVGSRMRRRLRGL